MKKCIEDIHFIQMELAEQQISERLNDFLVKQQIKKGDLAAMLGITDSNLSNKLTGARALDVALLYKVLMIFPALSPDYLLFGRLPILRKNLETYTDNDELKFRQEMVEELRDQIKAKDEEIKALHGEIKEKDSQIAKLFSMLPTFQK